MTDSQVDPLPLPPNALEQGGVEVLRALIVKNKLEVSLRRAFETADVWGMLIADIARHAARVFADETDLSEDEALQLIRDVFNAEIDMPTDRGSTNAVS